MNKLLFVFAICFLLICVGCCKHKKLENGTRWDIDEWVVDKNNHLVGFVVDGEYRKIEYSSDSLGTFTAD